MSYIAAPASLQCPNCASALNEETWDRESGVANCSYCRSVVHLPEHIRRFRPRPRLLLPPSISLSTEGGGFTIIHRWARFNNPAIAVNIAISALYIVIHWGMDFTRTKYNGGLPTLAVLLVVGFSYCIIAAVVNRSWIRVFQGVLSVTHGPLPWGRKFVMPCCEIDQLYCREVMTTSNQGPRVRYEVWIATVNGRTHRLVSGASLDRDQVLYIEQQLEGAMGIHDRIVPGEIYRL